MNIDNLDPREDIKRYVDKWDNTEEYTMQEQALQMLFLNKRDNHLSSDDLLIKCSALNDFYSTNIFKVYYVVLHYMKVANLAERLDAGDISLVDDLRKVNVPQKDQNGAIIRWRTIDYYSFATKFCSHHNPEAFPIYDSNVEYTLKTFRSRDNRIRFANRDLRNYQKFVDIVKTFQQEYDLKQYDFKAIDCYLWQLGKDLQR